MINSIDIILISIIKIIIFINNIITKISLIYETEKELKYYKNVRRKYWNDGRRVLRVKRSNS